MVLATVALLGAAFARWPYVWKIGNPFVYFGLAYLFIVALAIWDSRTRGALHPVTRWGGLALIVSLPVRLALAGTAAWLAFASLVDGTRALKRQVDDGRCRGGRPAALVD